MTKSKQNKTEMQRYSGPELGELLDRVVTELGPAAEISEVNKIRSGGVGGFFCREEYEIIVDARSGATRAKKPAAPMSKATIAAPTAVDSVSDEIAASDKIAFQDDISFQDDIAFQEEPAVSDAKALSADQPDGATEVFGGPRPRSINGTDERFLALLERRLDETSETEANLASRRVRRPAPRPSKKLPVPEPRTSSIANIEDPAPRPRPAPVVAETPEMPVTPGVRQPMSGFWARVSMARHQLVSILPAPSRSLVIIGPLSLTTPVICRLRSETELASADVIVLTDRAEIISEPNWQLVRSGHQLVDLANERAGQPTLLVIDVPVDLPQWVAPLQQRLRLAGVGAFRYAVPGVPSVDQLKRYRLGSDVPYILDLVSRVEPDRLVELIELQHPIASVGGATLTAELLVAMQEQVGVGR